MIVDGSSTSDDLGVKLLLQARFFHATLLDEVKYSTSSHLFSWSPFGLALGVVVYLTCPCFTCFLAV